MGAAVAIEHLPQENGLERPAAVGDSPVTEEVSVGLGARQVGRDT